MQVCAASEAQMDKLAKKLALDPAELRPAERDGHRKCCDGPRR